MARSATALRGHILESALRLFATHGFRGTSLQDIASDAGCSKASLLYHFANKDSILVELLVGAEQELAELHERIAGLEGEQAARAAVTGLVSVAMNYRQQVKILIHDLQSTTSGPGLPDLLTITEQLADALAGRSRDARDQVRAKMALAAIFLTAAADFGLLKAPSEDRQPEDRQPEDQQSEDQQDAAEASAATAPQSASSDAIDRRLQKTSSDETLRNELTRGALRLLDLTV